jgi:hypothetical protein
VKPIKFKCAKCGNEKEILPDFLKYFIEFQDMKSGADLVCDTCQKPIPTRDIYQDYLEGKYAQ